MEKTLKELAEECLQVQDACNLVAVANGMGRSISRLRDLLGDWDVAYRHPITRLWVDKLASLSGYPQAGSFKDYDEVYKIIEKGENHE